MWPSLEVRSIHEQFARSQKKDPDVFFFRTSCWKRAFRVPGYHQPTMACLGQAVQSRFLNRSADMFLRYTFTPLAVIPGNCIQSSKVLSSNVNQKSWKVSIKKMVFINTESLDVSFKILVRLLHHSIEFPMHLKRRLLEGQA